jgi:hypothetical protein
MPLDAGAERKLKASVSTTLYHQSKKEGGS